MTSETDALLRIVAGKTESKILAGTFRGLDGLRAVVDFDGGRAPAYLFSGFMPELNEPVWVLVQDGVAYVAGPTRPKPGNGEIVSADDGLAVVETAIGEVSATYDGSVEYEPGTLVKLMWQEGAHVVGVRGEAPEVEVPPPPSGGAREHTITFAALDSGSWQSGQGWRTRDVWSSASNIGAWFYGDQIRDTIPDSAVIVSAEIYLPRPDRLLGARPFGRHDHAGRPPGSLAIHAQSTLPGTSGWVSIPTSLIDHLKTNSGGLGFALGGWNVWPGKGRDDQSGAVRVKFIA